MARYKADKIAINTTVLPGVESFDISDNLAVESLGTDGTLDAGLVYALARNQRVSIQTVDLGTALTLLGIGGVALATASGFVAYARPFSALGVITATGSVKFLATAGAVYPRSISASQNGRASMSLEVVCCKPASGAPLISSASTTALLAHAALTKCYTLGAVKFGSTLLTRCVDMQFDCGITNEETRGDGDIDAKESFIVSRRPQVNLTFDDAAILPTYAATLATGGVCSIWFRSVSNSGVPDADAATTHIKISFPSAAVYVNSYGSGDGFMPRLTLTPVIDSSGSAIMSFGTGAIA